MYQYIAQAQVPSSDQERDGEAETEAPCSDTKAGRSRAKTILSLVKDIVLVLLAIHGLWLLYTVRQGTTTKHELQQQPPPPEARRSCNCGSSVAEAIARGCKYDSLGAGWLPDHCRDDELLAEFDQAGDGPDGHWTYWLDRNHTQTISLSDLALKGDDPDFRFHMSIEWHKVHCIYYWRKEHRARFNGKMVEKRSDNEAHIKHCGHVLMGMTGPGTVSGVELNMDHVEEE